MILSTLQRLSRDAFEASAFLFAPIDRDPVAEAPVALRDFADSLRAAGDLAEPGHMTLHAVRDGGTIVDFEWDRANAAALRLLRADSGGLRGRRLLDLLAGRAGRFDIFNQYRQVVEIGPARAVQQAVALNGSVAVLHHAALRWRDGVAVTLTNLTAVRHEFMLREELLARARTRAPDHPA